MQGHPDAALEKVLQASLDRPFSTDPHERFFTGRGMHTFANFDDEIAGLVPLRTAFQHSINLPYIRLMRELVQFYTAEANLDQQAILADRKHPQRRDILEAAMEQESRALLERYLIGYRKLDYDAAVLKMCGKNGVKRFSIFHLTENPDATLTELREETRRIYPELTAAQDSLLRSYHKQFAGRRTSRQDQAFLLGRNQVEVWVVRDRRDQPEPRFAEALQRSRELRREMSEWIYSSSRDAQNLRIRTELERRAFIGIHKAWKRLGFPFEALVPSLATAIGSSGDRPQALAELVGIIQNGGRRVPFLRVDALHFAEATPYETHFEPRGGQGEQVMQPEVATTLRKLMHSVVEGGTARRVNGVLKMEDGHSIEIGGKTGSGDNRYERVAADGSILSSRAINRTASFVFVAGENFFGMISAYVPGEEAGEYKFTSTLALQAFRSLAPAIDDLIAESEARHASPSPDSGGERATEVTRVAAPASQVASRP
jgi:cell division protein FtsI/penicillin-binding protein 2